MRRWVLVALFAGGCDFQALVMATPDAEPPIMPDAPPRPDGAMTAPDDIAHVQPDDEYLGLDDVMISAPITIDTSSMNFGMVLPAGATFAPAPQLSGPELAVLHVRKLEVRAKVRARGRRPLIVIADAIELFDQIDVGGHHQEPGAGAMTSGGGTGSAGKHFGSYTDSGAGGGSYGAAGADGGPTSCNGCPENPLRGGGPGPTYNPGISTLIGGSPGGRSFAQQGLRCNTRDPGGGGGAVQLYARTQIIVAATGSINAGGGGGLGGDRCQDAPRGQPVNWLAGHGGGSGGAIVLQSAIVRNEGKLAANGGGGGAGAGQTGDGGDGEDGKLGNAVARGGATSGQYSAAGGAGAVIATPAGIGATGIGSGNGGGGGGGLGQIVLMHKGMVTIGDTSPTATTQMF